ncbi:MAG TPA: LytTR family DNA-binding domain-containing protein [Bacteroidia bacterium]
MIIKTDKFQKSEFSLKDVILVPHKNYYFVLNIPDILYIKSEKSYCTIVMISGTQHLLISGMKILMTKLPGYFIRVHHSYIINVCHAHSIHKGKMIKLNNNDEIPISRRKKRELFELVTVG